MAAQVAGDEPDIAAKSAHAPRFETTNPPGIRVNQRSNASYKSAPALVDAIAAPIKINIGIDNNAKLSSLPNRISGTSSSAPNPSKMIKNNAETTNNPLATEIPENKMKIVTAATIAPKNNGSISGRSLR